jgi:hypothetical protein
MGTHNLKKINNVWRAEGAGGVLRRSAARGLDISIDALCQASRSLKIQRALLYDYRLNRRFVETNISLEGAHQGQRAFIIGTGPSLVHQDLSHLSNEITFAVNSFWMHPAIAIVQPTYYVLLDSVFLDGSPHSSTNFGKLTSAADKSTFLVPANCRRSMIESGCLPDERTKFVSFAGVLHDSVIKWPELHRYVPGMWNVVQLALLAALYMGCNPIYLIGCDHDYVQPGGD